MTDQTSTSPTPARRAAPWRRLVPPGIAVALIAVFAIALRTPAGDQVASPLVGKPAPEFALQSLDGGTVRLSDFKGRPVVLNFWASWCVPCREEAPMLRELSERQRAEGVAIVGVLFNETSDTSARDFIREYALAYPNLKDPRIDTGVNYGVSGVPETFFIDAEGTVRRKDSGGLTRERLNAGLQSIGVPPL